MQPGRSSATRSPTESWRTTCINDRLVMQEKTLRTWSYQVYACCCEEVDRHQQSKLGNIVVKALGWKACWWRNIRVACDRQNMVQGAKNASQKMIHQTEAYPTPQNKSAVPRSIPDRHQISSVHWLKQRRSRWREAVFSMMKDGQVCCNRPRIPTWTSIISHYSTPSRQTSLP